MTDPAFERTIRALARRLGLQIAYRDALHRKREPPVTTLCAVLESMGLNCATMDTIRQSRAELLAQEWRNVLDPVIVHSSSSTSLILSFPLGDKALEQVVIDGTVCNDAGEIRPFRFRGSTCRIQDIRILDGQRYARVILPFPPCGPPGYYQLHVHVSTKKSAVNGCALVIVPPPQCYFPRSARRMWGITLQLATLRSSTNWGCGDFSDLRHVIQWAGEHGADTIGVNPLCAGMPAVISPYSPSSRLFLDPLYLDITAIPEFQQSDIIRRRVNRSPLRHALASLRDRDIVDYAAVRSIKRQVLESLYHVFCTRHLDPRTLRARAFRQFVKSSGPLLQRFAIFQVLMDRFDGTPWSRWPSEYRHPKESMLDAFCAAHRKEVQFHQYLQWLCEEQLGSADEAARQAGVGLRLYHDLPVGIHPHGADAWMFQTQLAQGMSIGAPPDAFNLQGQNWGLVPFNPWQLRTHRHELFIETIRRTMRHGGVLRLDHVMGLFRLFWIPDQAANADGVYVRYPAEELLAIVALESMRARVMVVGEDLGTVTSQIRKRLRQRRMLSYRVLLFEHTPTGRVRQPSRFPDQALVAVTTHDLPTIRGFWSGRDIEIKARLGIYPHARALREARAQRDRERLALLEALHREGLLPPGYSLDTVPSVCPDDLCEALYRYVARTPSRLIIVTLEDLTGEHDAPNFPGIPVEAYPSWQLKLKRSLEQWMNDPVVSRMIHTVRRERRGISLPEQSSRTSARVNPKSIPFPDLEP